jgi:hypothetical protein
MYDLSAPVRRDSFDSFFHGNGLQQQSIPGLPDFCRHRIPKRGENIPNHHQMY